MSNVSSWRFVYQCKKCTFKYKEKPNYCTNKNGLCKSENFIKVKVYCLDKILSYRAFVNAIIGGRRKGKTYAVAEFCIDRWKTEKSKFTWVRRYKTEMKKALDSFSKLGYKVDGSGVYFEEITTEIKLVKGKEKELEKKTKIYIGTIVTITTASRIRGGEFNDYDTLVIDEYGDEAGTTFKKEFTLINSLITSIIDEKEFGIVFVLSNNVDRFLPLYNKIGVKWDQEWTYNWQNSSVAHVVEDKDRVWVGASAPWLRDTEYFDYAIHNRPMDFDKQLIEKYKLDFIEPEFCFKLGGLNENLCLRKYNNNFVIDECYKCNHDWIAIDNSNSIKFIKSINQTNQMKLLQLYLKQIILYTTPKYKLEFTSWIQNHLYLL